MRILHTSDWHLGKYLGNVPLDDVQQHALRQLRDHLASEAYDVLVVAGDIFDRPTPSNDAVRMLGAWLGEVRALAPQLKVVLIAGNHDNGPRLAWAATLLDAQGVYLRGETHAIDEPIDVTGRDGSQAQLWALPFLTAASLDEQSHSQVGAMDEALRRIALRQDRSKAQVLVAHCFVQGGAVSDSERTLIGNATQIAVEVFAGFDYVALGHLHRPQAPAPHVRYSGSLARYSFSEVDYPKQFLDVEVQAGQPCRVTEHRLRDLHTLRRLRGSLQELSEDPKFASMVDDYVELTLDPPVHLGNPLEALRRRWKNILSFRNDLLPPSGALQSLPEAQGGPRDLEADFVRFDRQFTDQPEPAPEVLAAFRKLHQRLSEEGHEAD